MIRVPPDTERAVLESAFRVNADHKLRDRFQIVLWAGAGTRQQAGEP
ncbi:MAG: hypothetical protein U0840_21680 [Gemmataceae bacterium]